MTKHTAGPWRVGKEEDSDRKLVYIRIESLSNTVGTTGVYGHKRNGSSAGTPYTDRFGTARFKPVISADEARANARLIAAAPEMLEALQKAIAWGGHPYRVENVKVQPWFSQAEAAIRKATEAI